MPHVISTSKAAKISLQPETADRFMKVTRKSGFKNRGDGDEKNVHHIGLDKPARLTVICNRQP